MFTVRITELLKKQKKISNKDRLWAENLKKLQLLEKNIAFSKRKYSFMYKPPQIQDPPPPQEKFGEKALWPKISPGAYYGNFTVVLLNVWNMSCENETVEQKCSHQQDVGVTNKD